MDILLLDIPVSFAQVLKRSQHRKNCRVQAAICIRIAVGMIWDALITTNGKEVMENEKDTNTI